MHKFTCRFDEEIYAMLAKIAKQQHCSLNQALRICVIQHHNSTEKKVL